MKTTTHSIFSFCGVRRANSAIHHVAVGVRCAGSMPLLAQPTDEGPADCEGGPVLLWKPNRTPKQFHGDIDSKKANPKNIKRQSPVRISRR